jgi:hypothetical protein
MQACRKDTGDSRNPSIAISRPESGAPNEPTTSANFRIPAAAPRCDQLRGAAAFAEAGEDGGSCVRDDRMSPGLLVAGHNEEAATRAETARNRVFRRKFYATCEEVGRARVPLPCRQCLRGSHCPHSGGTPLGCGRRPRWGLRGSVGRALMPAYRFRAASSPWARPPPAVGPQP